MPPHQIVIIGGGNAGISTAAQLLRKNRALDIAIVDPAEKHYYQPAWTLVGSGQTRQHQVEFHAMYQLKREVLPRMYWGAILKGLA